MATCNAIIQRAFRMARIVAIGDEPTAHELTEGMAVLEAIYQRLADTALSAFEEIAETDDYTARPNERIYCDGTVTLPDLTEDDKRVPDLACVTYQDENTDGAWRSYVSDRGDWVRLDSLTQDSEAPLSKRNEEGLSALVAVEIAEQFGREAGATTLQKARRFQAQLQPVNRDPVEYY